MKAEQPSECASAAHNQHELAVTNVDGKRKGEIRKSFLMVNSFLELQNMR